MYSLVSAIVKLIHDQSRWTNANIGDMSMIDLYSLYDGVIVTLSNPFLTKNVSLDLSKIQGQYGGSTMTLNQVLVANGNATLPTDDRTPIVRTRYAKYRDIVKTGFKVQPVHPSIAPGTPMPPEDRTWLLLTRPDTDYTTCYQSLLPVVNGFIYPTDASVNGLYVQHGDLTRKQSGKAELGLINFQQLGKLRLKPITPTMLYKQDPGQLYQDRVHVDLGEDVSGKTLMLVLGGYLHVLDPQTFYRVSDSAAVIVFKNLSYLDRYYESKKYLDLSSLGLETSDLNPNQISVTQLLSDAVIEKYVTLPQSFFVILDNPDIFVEREKIRSNTGPGMYTSFVPPIYPLVGELGKINNFWSVSEKGQWAITCSDAFRQRRQYWTNNYKQLPSVSSESEPSNRTTNGNLYHLKIGTNVFWQ